MADTKEGDMLRGHSARQQQQQHQQRRGLPQRADETNELIAARSEMRECIEGCRARLRQQRLSHQHAINQQATEETISEETSKLQEATR